MNIPVGVSLGWNCNPAIRGVSNNLRKSKENGYLTMPFDLGVTNLKGIVHCLDDEFKDFTNSEYLQLIDYNKEVSHVKLDHMQPNETLLVNTKYNFYFNHESPGHGELYKSQKWEEGINHYVNNDFLHFKNKYNRRIQHFKHLLNNENIIIMFLLEGYGVNNKYVNDLKHVLDNKYPSLKYELRFFEVGDKHQYKNIMKQTYSLFVNDDEFMNYMDHEDFL